MPRYAMLAQGRVQGVGFRWAAQRDAQARGLTGWVRNRPDGCVELEVQGDPPAVSAFSAALRRGTGYSRLERLDIREIPELPEKQGFRVRV
ncbi:acylphosphatase [Clostridium sp. D33t1_170424_F3]|uniref:acylphosphatase n=1 Tax=Clostridium sp. D33t1_170424_F3 TaxID=2787099 RepID=UPI0018AB3C79|nr:acylphosphatase [Clostridium sp. D33t1_170424_F3]MDC0700626.1 acylphosphatase [Blautia wexlerae]